MWVLYLNGLCDNEAVDRLSRAGLACLVTSLECFCGVSASHFREVVNVLEWEEIFIHWIETADQR